MTETLSHWGGVGGPRPKGVDIIFPPMDTKLGDEAEKAEESVDANNDGDETAPGMPGFASKSF